MNAAARAIISLPYSKNTDALLRLVSKLPLPVVFESNGESIKALKNEDQSNRYTILCAAPAAHYQPTKPESKDCIFSKIRDLKANYLATQEPLSKALLALPFQGGIAGYLGYPDIKHQDALEITECFFGVYLWAVVVDHQLTVSSLVFHPNCPEQTRKEIAGLMTATEIPSSPANPKATKSFSLNSSFKALTTFKSYQQAYETIEKYILSGDSYQVNLTQKFSADCQGDPLEAYIQLKQTSPAPFSAYIHCHQSAIISLSPERFLLNRKGHIETKPIKGTVPRDVRSAAADQEKVKQLINSEKDRAENLMIVDLLRNDLGRISVTGSVKVNKLFAIESFSNVHHLVSTVSSQLALNNDAVDMLSACFPGGSITGAPKLRAMEVIEEVENSKRGPYCGSVFYWASSGDFDSSISIRTLQWKEQASEGQSDSIHCWAGGGIVADSQCESEYQECFDKIQNLMSALESGSAGSLQPLLTARRAAVAR